MKHLATHFLFAVLLYSACMIYQHATKETRYIVISNDGKGGVYIDTKTSLDAEKAPSLFAMPLDSFPELMEANEHAVLLSKSWLNRDKGALVAVEIIP